MLKRNDNRPQADKRLKLVYVIDVLDTNLAGTENQLIRMINGLDKGAFEVGLVCLRAHPWLRENGATLDCNKEVIGSEHSGRASFYQSMVRLIRYFRAAKPDVVHTFFPVSNIVAVIAARLAGVRGVVSSRRDYGEWMSPRYLWMTKLANRFADRIVANSGSVRALTVDREKVKTDKVDVVLNGIEPAAYRRIERDVEIKRRLGIPDASPVVGIVANFRPMKHHETFIQAAAEILKHRDDVHFLLVGGTHSTVTRKQVLEALGRSLGISARLHFVGVQKDVKPYLSIMDVGVNCSEREGLSNAIMEYMAAGVPAIVSASGGNTDLIADGTNGFVFKLDDHGQLAQYVLRLLCDEALRQRFAVAARKRIDNEMSNDVMLTRYTTLYRQLAG